MVLVIDVAWEPRLRPIGLKQRLADVIALDENGNSLAVNDRKAEIESLVQNDATAVELEIPLALPPRRVKRDRQLPGQPPGHGAGKDRNLHLLGTAGRQKRGKTHRRRHRHPRASAKEQRPLGSAHAGKVRQGRQLPGDRTAAGSCKTRPTSKATMRNPSPTTPRKSPSRARTGSAWTTSSVSSSRPGTGNSSTRRRASSSLRHFHTRSRASSCPEGRETKG